jgi:hypothetical protein
VCIINWIPFPKINKHLAITVHTVCSGYASGPVSVFEGSHQADVTWHRLNKFRLYIPIP